ncbi:nucleoside 2-deoxyribosyltransferase [Selenomonas noxia]|jgi:putative pfkB family carbohydrate kinase
MPRQTVLVIGEVFVDTHLDIITENGPLVRLGGVFHSARAFDSLGLNYALAYYAPAYLDDDINEWALYLNTKGCYKLGNINKAPNIMLVNESKEAGDQEYYNIIKDQAEYVDLENIQEIVDIINPTDILLFPGRYDTSKIMRDLDDFTGKIHIDFHYDSEHIFRDNDRRIESIILSTSSIFYKDICGGTLAGALEHFNNKEIHQFLVKENRGGSFCYISEEDRLYEAPSYYVPTMHSVGVGDVYNSVFISELFETDMEKRMRLAALCAAQYAGTMDYEKFRENVQLVHTNISELNKLAGIRLPWTDRRDVNIYLAAPDFPNVDTSLLDRLSECLLYHNFAPRLPIRENGIASKTMSSGEKLNLYYKDIVLMNESDLLIAILLYNDPGTLVELGMFKQTGKPTILFDPFNCCENMFVLHTPDYLCKNIADVIDAVYLCLGKRS